MTIKTASPPVACDICRGALGDAADPTSADCGGTCLRCMAAAGDPDCVASMAAFNHDRDRAQRLLRKLCRATHSRWIEAPWKLVRAPDESDDAYKACSEAGAATHGYGGHLHRFSHKSWSLERCNTAPRDMIGVRRAAR